MKMSLPSFRVGFAVLTLCFAAAYSLRAQTIEWIGGNQNSFGTAANWSPSTDLPADTTANLTLNLVTQANVTTTILTGANSTIKALFINNTSGNFNNATSVLRIAAANNNTTVVNRMLSFGVNSAGNTIINLSTNANVSFVASTLSGNASTLSLNLAYNGYGTINVDSTSFMNATGANMNIIGTGGLIKTGSGTILLGSLHTYTGGFELKEGIVQIGANSTNATNSVTAGAFGTGTLILSGGTLASNSTTANRNITNNITLNGTVTIGNVGGMSIGFNNASNSTTTLAQDSVLNVVTNLTMQQPITGSFSLTKVGTGTLFMGGGNASLGILGSNSSNFTGGFELKEGTISLSSSGAVSNNVTVGTQFGVGVLKLSGGTIISSNTSAGGDRTIPNAIALNGTVSLGVAGSLAGISANTAWNSTTTLLQNSTLFVPAAASIWAQPISGNFGLTKTGTAMLTLSGVNTYTGITTLSEGSLRLTGSLAGGLTSAAGTTFSGSGTVAGNAVLAGAHEIGAGAVGIQTFSSSLTYNSGASVAWKLSTNTATQGDPSPLFDQVVVGNNVNFAGATALSLTFNSAGSNVLWSDPLWSANQSWKIYDAASVTGFANLTLTTANWQDSAGNLFNTALPGSTLSLSELGGDVFLNYKLAPVPEPATVAAIFGGVGLCYAFYRRRQRA